MIQLKASTMLRRGGGKVDASTAAHWSRLDWKTALREFDRYQAEHTNTGWEEYVRRHGPREVDDAMRDEISEGPRRSPAAG
jgi:hypothetical protein